MLELYILGGFLLLVIVAIPLYFVGAALYQRKQDKENATKKKVYISTLVLTYCGVGTALMNKKRLKRSPDRADVFNMIVEKAITLGRFNSSEVKQVARMINNGWAKVGTTRALGSSCGRKMRIR